MGYSLRSIAKGSILYTFGQLLTKASAFFLIPLYTRFLTPDDYGIVGYLQFILQILATILMFGFYGAQTRFFYEYKDDLKALGEFLFSINAWLLAILVPVALFIGFFGDNFYGMFGPEDIPFYPYLPLIIWTSVFQVMNQLIISYWVARKEYLRTTLLQILQFVLISGFTVFFVVIYQVGASGYFKGMLYGQIFFFIAAYPSYCRHFFCKINWKHIFSSLSFGFPIVIHLLSGTVHSLVDRAILAELVPLNELGLYTLGYQVGMVMYLVTISVNSAWQPSYYELLGSNNVDKELLIRRTYNLWIVVMSFICIIGILWGGGILILITPEQFNGAAQIVPFVFIGYFFHGLYLFIVLPVFFHKKTKLLFIFTGSAAIVNIALNFLLIPHLGIIGAALATAFSMLFQSIVVYIYSKKLNDYGVDLVATAAISVVLGLSIIGPIYVNNVILSQLIRTGFFLLMIFVSYIFFKQDFERMFLSFLKQSSIQIHKSKS